MTEEEYFRKHYPDVCYNGKPLSPYWDFFQDGVEFGERQSKKRIAELEKENAELTNFIMQSKKDGISPINALIIKNIGGSLTKAIKLLKFWVNDFYDGSNHPNKYEERHKALVETEQLIKEIEK